MASDLLSDILIFRHPCLYISVRAVDGSDLWIEFNAGSLADPEEVACGRGRAERLAVRVGWRALVEHLALLVELKA